LFVIVFAAIEQEKGQQRLISGIENFDPKSLKPTETQEKNPLPTQEGQYLITETACG
jgi:Thymosin beta-4 family